MFVKILPLVDGCLAGALLFLCGIVWEQWRAMEALRKGWLADRLSFANKLGTLEQQTCFDALTGLRNQRMFEAKVSTLLRGTEPFTLIYIDLDGLKAVNDGQGHPAGDQLIRRAVKAIRSAVRRRADLDGLFRRGDAADEFWWVVERSRIHIAVQLAEQVLTALRSVSITASIGVVEWDGRSLQTCEQIELAAEQQLQRAKHDGRNCVRWSPNLIEHRAPAALPPAHTLDAVPIEIETERTQRHAA